MRLGPTAVAAAVVIAAVAGSVSPGTAEFHYRGGIVFDLSEETRFVDVDCTSQNPAALYGCGEGIDGEPLGAAGDFGSTPGLEIGVGRGLASVLRFEAVAQYRPGLSFRGRSNFVQTRGIQAASAELSSLSGLLAAYLEWPGRGGPFVGGGAGLSRVAIGETRLRFRQTETFVPGAQVGSASVWMVTAGVSVGMGPCFLLDLAWRYTESGPVETDRGAGRIVWRDGSHDPRGAGPGRDPGGPVDPWPAGLGALGPLTRERDACPPSPSTLAGDLFDHKHLTGNAMLAEAIGEHSGGRYLCVLPQDLEQSTDRAVDIRNQDLKQVMACDLGLFNFDGPDLDSGTVVEFMLAKMLDIPSVVLRSDFRSSGDQEKDGDDWNLMCSSYPRVRVVSFDAMAWYQQASSPGQPLRQDRRRRHRAARRGAGRAARPRRRRPAPGGALPLGGALPGGRIRGLLRPRLRGAGAGRRSGGRSCSESGVARRTGIPGRRPALGRCSSPPRGGGPPAPSPASGRDPPPWRGCIRPGPPRRPPAPAARCGRGGRTRGCRRGGWPPPAGRRPGRRGAPRGPRPRRRRRRR